MSTIETEIIQPEESTKSIPKSATISTPKMSSRAEPLPPQPKEDLEKVKKQEQSKYKAPKKITPTILDYSSMSLTDQMEYRNSFKVAFKRIANDYPGLDIKCPPDTEPLESVHDLYFRYIREIITKLNTDDYTMYLVVILIGVEIFATTYMKLPLGGFTSHQLNNFKRYQFYLREMGEQEAGEGVSTHPPWMKILFLGVFQAIVFAIMKLVSDKIPGGGSLLETIKEKVIDHMSDPGGVEMDDEDGVPVPKSSGGFDFGSIAQNILGNSNFDLGQIGNFISGLTSNKGSNTSTNPNPRRVPTVST